MDSVEPAERVILDKRHRWYVAGCFPDVAYMPNPMKVVEQELKDRRAREAAQAKEKIAREAAEAKAKKQQEAAAAAQLLLDDMDLDEWFSDEAEDLMSQI